MMLKQILSTAVLLTVFANASAQSTAVFGATGTVTPSSCTVTLTGGVVAMGTVTATTIRGNTEYAIAGTTDSAYVLPPIAIPIEISCGSATNVKVQFTDNKPGKALKFDGNDVLRFGLVDGAGTTPIGSYSVEFRDVRLDAVQTNTYFVAANGTTTWRTTYPGSSLGARFGAPNYTVGFGKTVSATAPEAFTKLTGNLYLERMFSKKSLREATTNITVNGSGMLTLVYL